MRGVSRELSSRKAYTQLEITPPFVFSVSVLELRLRAVGDDAADREEGPGGLRREENACWG